jgi:hypothetical protein
MGQTAGSSEHTKKLAETVAELHSQLSHANKEIDTINERLSDREKQLSKENDKINTINDKLTIKTLLKGELKIQN